METETRIKEIIAKQLDGYTRTELLEFIGTWGLKRSQADNLIRLASERFKEINKSSIQDIQALVFNNYLHELRQARAEGDRSSIISILKEVSKIHGLDKVTINHIVEDKRELADLSDADLEAMLVEGESDSAAH